MGNTVWILSESTDSDDWDHSFILKFEKALDKLSIEIGVDKISDFYDHSILAEEFDEDVLPNWIDAGKLELLFASLISAIKGGKSKKLTNELGLLEELEDCLTKLVTAKDKGEKVRVSIVP